MNGFCTRSMPMTVTLRLIDFLKSFSACLNSSEKDANGTRLYCTSDDIGDQWLGILEDKMLWDLQKKNPFSVMSQIRTKC